MDTKPKVYEVTAHIECIVVASSEDKAEYFVEDNRRDILDNYPLTYIHAKEIKTPIKCKYELPFVDRDCDPNNEYNDIPVNDLLELLKPPPPPDPNQLIIPFP